MRQLSVFLLAALLLTGCVPPQQVAGNCPAAPPVQREDVPKPPVSEAPLVWRPGHWDWNGGTYGWMPGAWETREGHSTQWMDGFWSRSPDATACAWVSAHWL